MKTPPLLIPKKVESVRSVESMIIITLCLRSIENVMSSNISWMKFFLIFATSVFISIGKGSECLQVWKDN